MSLPKIAVSLAILSLASCGLFGERGPVKIAAIGPINPNASPLNGELSPANAALLDATSQGLVSYDGEGQIDTGLADRWNVEKRFARLSVQGVFLVLELDVIVAGGVSETYLRATTELWDRLLQEFLLFLRANASDQDSAADAPAEGAAEAPQRLDTEPVNAETTDATAAA